MAAWLRLGVATVICLVVLAGVLTRPLGVRAAVQAYDEAAEDDLALRKAVLSRGEEAAPALIERALSPRCRSRERIVLLLRELEPEEAYAAFAKALKEFRLEHRVCAAEALGMLGKADARPLLEWALRSDDARLEAAARSALHRFEREVQ